MVRMLTFLYKVDFKKKELIEIVPIFNEEFIGQKNENKITFLSLLFGFFRDKKAS